MFMSLLVDILVGARKREKAKIAHIISWGYLRTRC